MPLTSQGKFRMKTRDWATGRDEKALKKLVALACSSNSEAGALWLAGVRASHVYRPCKPAVGV